MKVYVADTDSVQELTCIIDGKDESEFITRSKADSHFDWNSNPDMPSVTLIDYNLVKNYLKGEEKLYGTLHTMIDEYGDQNPTVVRCIEFITKRDAFFTDDPWYGADIMEKNLEKLRKENPEFMGRK